MQANDPVYGVTIAIPIKRGLKVCETFPRGGQRCVTIAIPIKRGLKEDDGRASDVHDRLQLLSRLKGD